MPVVPRSKLVTPDGPLLLWFCTAPCKDGVDWPVPLLPEEVLWGEVVTTPPELLAASVVPDELFAGCAGAITRRSVVTFGRGESR